MECLYWNCNIDFMEALYEKYKLWEPLNDTEGWSKMIIPNSKQLKKYFENDGIRKFLANNAEKYLLAVIYKDNGGMDMLPCFTETMKLGENITNAKKRFLQEELFSNSDVEYLETNKWKKQTIHTLHTNVRNIDLDYQSIINDTGNDDRLHKLNLFVIVDKKEDAIEFINGWRSRRHNLGTESERYHMIDLCLVEVKFFN